jgi:hypothetical protein
MNYLFLLLGVFIGGIIDRYIMPVCDLILQKFSNNKQFEAQKLQREINRVEHEMVLEELDTKYEGALIQKDILDIEGDMQKQDTNVIGYQIDNRLEYPEDWDEETFKLTQDEITNRNKIGF